MRVLIVTAGSRGDVAPFTGLGSDLRQAGHDVALAAHAPFADTVRACGLGYRPLPGDPVELTRRRTAAPSPEAARSVFAEFLDELGDGIVDAVAAGTDVVLTASGPAPLSRAVAAGTGVPSVGTYLLPGMPSREFPPPGWPEPGDLGPEANLAAGRRLHGGGDALYADVLGRLRTRFALPEASATPPDDWPICHGYSPSVLPRPGDWPAAARVTGYWWPARPDGWHPAAELVDFLRAGPPPVFVGFGSMLPADSGQVGDVVTDAVRRAGARAVVQAGWAGLSATGDDVLAIDDVPHDWLFPQVAAVVHHMGAGTTAAGLRAGVPTVPVPVTADQPFWAERLHRRGAATTPIPVGELTADALAGALRACLDEPGYRSRSMELSRRIGAEDGSAGVLAVIDRLAG